MNLPEEILDKILSHLPSDNGQSLWSCSLVSNPWLDPSQRLLFARICIQQHNYRSWLKEISPANTELLRHAHSLTYTSYGMPDSDRCVHALRDYLPSSTQNPPVQCVERGANHPRTSHAVFNLPTYTFVVIPLRCFDHMEFVRRPSWVFPPSQRSLH